MPDERDSNRQQWLQRWRDEQFELQLELEELTPDETRERAREVLKHADPDRRSRITFALRVHAALLRSPVLTGEEQEARLDAWCEGFGLTVAEVLHDFRESQLGRR